MAFGRCSQAQKSATGRLSRNHRVSSPKGDRKRKDAVYQKTITHLYSQTLSRVLPESPQEQQDHLEAISEIGLPMPQLGERQSQMLVAELERRFTKPNVEVEQRSLF